MNNTTIEGKLLIKKDIDLGISSIFAKSFSLNNNDTIQLFDVDLNNTKNGNYLLTITNAFAVNRGQQVNIIFINNTLTLIVLNGNDFSEIEDNVDTINIFVDSNKLTIQNKTGDQVQFICKIETWN